MLVAALISTASTTAVLAGVGAVMVGYACLVVFTACVWTYLLILALYIVGRLILWLRSALH